MYTNSSCLLFLSFSAGFLLQHPGPHPSALTPLPPTDTPPSDSSSDSSTEKYSATSTETYGGATSPKIVTSTVTTTTTTHTDQSLSPSVTTTTTVTTHHTHMPGHSEIGVPVKSVTEGGHTPLINAPPLVPRTTTLGQRHAQERKNLFRYIQVNVSASQSECGHRILCVFVCVTGTGATCHAGVFSHLILFVSPAYVRVY